MRKNHNGNSGMFNLRFVSALVLCLVSLSVGYLSFAAHPRKAASVGTNGTQINAPETQPPFTPVENSVTNGGLTVLGRVFTSGGWVTPGGGFPVVLTYQAGGTGATGATVSVTLSGAALFLQSTPAPASGNGTAGSPLVYNIGTVAPSGTGQIAIEARAKDLTEDPEVIWKDASSGFTLVAGAQPPKSARTHGPKVTTLETARYGDRPFPVVM